MKLYHLELSSVQKHTRTHDVSIDVAAREPKTVIASLHSVFMSLSRSIALALNASGSLALIVWNLHTDLT